ncbi:uncharacterized protein LOC124530734 isoform X1 [Vanessa cardui]|uniref:uncharacterized protein LOC124530734 isoform X1 n=1 Tax=Vanessa cardui TaxID=171605 RepID=UPI001F12C4E8|nr:uncharacterized protein LOC124530734 isoform X1 [Vanessa cardui]
MSLVNPKKYISFWGNCPADILLVIFRKLDFKSLVNSMFVNKYWRDVVEYYCQHFNVWDKLIEHGIDNKGVSFSEKSTLGCRDIIQCAQKWYDVKNAAVRFHHHYTFEVVKSICVYKGLKYEETSSLTADLSLPMDGVIGYNVLTLINKLHHEDCDCTQVRKAVLYDISTFKVYSNCCYVIDIRNVLWVYKADKCEWDVKVMARYYGNKDCICGLNVHQEEVYVLLKRGDVLRVDMECKKFEKVFELDVPMHYLDMKSYMFGDFSVLCAVPAEKEFQIHPQKEGGREGEQIVAACPGLTCVMEHGHILLLGYEDGKIEIFLTNNLIKRLTTPELRFYLQSYSESTVNKIIALDVYEDSDGHHLFVATKSDIYELLIYDK